MDNSNVTEKTILPDSIVILSVQSPLLKTPLVTFGDAERIKNLIVSLPPMCTIATQQIDNVLSFVDVDGHLLSSLFKTEG